MILVQSEKSLLRNGNVSNVFYYFIQLHIFYLICYKCGNVSSPSTANCMLRGRDLFINKDVKLVSYHNT